MPVKPDVRHRSTRRTLVAATALLLALAACTPKPAGAGMSACLFADDGADGPYFGASWPGAAEAGRELGYEVRYAPPDPESMARRSSAGCHVALAVGPAACKAALEASATYPGVGFVLIGNDFDALPAANVALYRFDERQAGFLAGLACALKAANGRAGAIVSSSAAVDGFQAGVAYANGTYGTDCRMAAGDVLVSDGTDGGTLAGRMFSRGVTVVYEGGGAAAEDILAECAARRGDGWEVWVVSSGVDRHEAGRSGGAAESCVTASILYSYDKAARRALRTAAEDSFPGGKTFTLGAADGAFALSNRTGLSERDTDRMQAALVGLADGSLPPG